MVSRVASMCFFDEHPWKLPPREAGYNNSIGTVKQQRKEYGRGKKVLTTPNIRFTEYANSKKSRRAVYGSAHLQPLNWILRRLGFFH